ncbi:MAG: hypothetical protein HC848_00755 [Limnobacter sp.]|nr:hypothetical protein [Limnobacter sp.]
MAIAVEHQQPELAKQFRKLLMHVSKFYNNGSLDVKQTDTSKTSVVDIFNLLAMAPKALEDGYISPDTVKTLLHPEYDDQSAVRSWREKEPESSTSGTDNSSTHKFKNYYCKTSEDAKKVVEQFAQDFSDLYPRVIETIQTIGVQEGFFATKEQCMQSMLKRAEFENKPIDRLIRFNLRNYLDEIIPKYEKSDCADLIKTTIDELIAESIRNVDAILKQGSIHVFQDHLEIQKAVINGTNYAIHVHENGDRHLVVSFQTNTLSKQNPLEHSREPLINSVDADLREVGMPAPCKKRSDIKRSREHFARRSRPNPPNMRHSGLIRGSLVEMLIFPMRCCN